MISKKFSALICGVLATTTILVGCGNKKDTAKEEVKKGEVEVAKEGEFPIVKEPVTLKVMTPENPDAKSLEDNMFTDWLQKETNVNIKWEIIPSDTVKEKVNITLASGDLPDVLMKCGINLTQMSLYGAQKIFLPLNDYIEKYGKETREVFKQKPQVKETLTMPDGNIYSLPQVNDCYHCELSNKMYIYKPWLDKLGLKVPETTDDLYNVLKAFKEKDPNGNGKADEIPLSGSPKNWNSDPTIWLMNAFLYNDGENDLIVNNGKIEAQFIKDEWKEGLKYIKKLYKEGLMDAQTFTQDADSLVRVGTSENNILGMAGGGTKWTFAKSLESDKNRLSDFAIAPPVKGPKGERVATLYPYGFVSGAYVITKDCKSPEVAFRLADMMYNEDVTLKSEWGFEGIDWRKAKEGELGQDGKPAKFALLTEEERNANADSKKFKGTSWMQSGPSFRPSELRFAFAVSKENLQEDSTYRDTKDGMEVGRPSTDIVVPPLVFSEEDSNEIADLTAQIKTFANEFKTKFIVGEADIDKDWDSYLKELENRGLKRWIEIYQKAYDAKKAALNK